MNILFRPGLTSRTFEASDQDTSSATYYYFGFLTQDGNWIIQRFDNSTPNVVLYRYASPSNNAGYSSYSSAWTARASLSYDYFNAVQI
jgi:hypothetical protein